MGQELREAKEEGLNLRIGAKTEKHIGMETMVEKDTYTTYTQRRGWRYAETGQVGLEAEGDGEKGKEEREGPGRETLGKGRNLRAGDE